MPAPVNDNWADAIELTGPGVSTASIEFATLEPSEPTPVAGGIDQTVWYKYTPVATGSIGITTNGSPQDTVIAVYTGAALASLVEVASDDDGGVGTNSLLNLVLTAGTTYYIQAGTFSGGEVGDMLLTLAVAPPNDDWAYAIELLGRTGEDTADITAASSEGSEPAPSGIYGTVWYKFTAAASGAATFSTAGSDPVYTYVSVYTGASLVALVEVVTDYPSVTIEATIGTTYYVRVGTGRDDERGDVVLTWTLPGVRSSSTLEVRERIVGVQRITQFTISVDKDFGEHVTNVQASPNVGG